jgi:hypothetical protein
VFEIYTFGIDRELDSVDLTPRTGTLLLLLLSLDGYMILLDTLDMTTVSANLDLLVTLYHSLAGLMVWNVVHGGWLPFTDLILMGIIDVTRILESSIDHRHLRSYISLCEELFRDKYHELLRILDQ